MKSALLLSESSVYMLDKSKRVAKGGGEVFFHNLAKALRKLNYKVTILAIQEFPGQKQKEVIDKINYKRVDVRSRSSLKILKYLKHAVKESKSHDIVFFNQFTPHLVLPFIKARKIAVIHDLYQKEGISFWIKQYGFIRGTFGNLVEKLQLQLDKKYADKILTVSDSSQQKIVDLLGDRVSGKIIQTPTIINLKDYIRTEKKEDFLLFVGRFVAYKHPATVLFVLKKIKEHHPSFKAVFIAPRIEKTSLENFNKAIKKLKIDPKDVYLKFDLPDSELKELFTKAKILLQPSSMEGQGIVTLEALASGTPVVAYDLPAYKDFLFSGKNCILVNIGDENALAQATLEMLKNYKYYQKNTNQYFEKKSPEKFVENLKQIF